jgi:hypothetical protein
MEPTCLGVADFLEMELAGLTAALLKTCLGVADE